MANIDDLKEKVKSLVDEISPRAIEMAEHIFDDPELSQKEFKAQKYLTEELKKNGFKVEEGIGGIETSFRAEFDSKKEGPAIALVAEYDALPKMGHACHHHIIASSSVNCAIALSKISDELCGKIFCVGTPAEELMDAKGIMIRNGALDGIDAGLMFHGGSRNNTNLIVLAVDGLEFSYKGKSAHAAAAPHEGINALDAVILLFTAINALRQQLKEDVRIHGNVIKGGDAVNIIPETAVARFYIRSQQRRYLNEVVEKVKNCAKGAALQTGAELEISIFEDPGNDLLKNSTLIKEFEENFESLGEKIDPDPFLLGSSDIGNLSYKIPVVHPMVKTADEGIALHTDKFLKFGKSDTAYRGMAAGMKSILMTAVRILMDPDFLKRIKNDFKENTRGL
ncbi:MAG: M20 family metallopeptidase [Spirochaetes bacterium]|nr:M20 family metallopeptidase [Spirochaetota bacterium]